MAFPLKWLSDLPELPGAEQLPSSQMSQLASFIRNLALEDKINGEQTSWLVAYENRFTPHAERLLSPPEEPKAPEDPPDPPDPPAAGQAPALPAGSIPEELAASIRELRLGFTAGLQKIDDGYANSLDKLIGGIDKLNEGYGELRLGNAQLQADIRSFLGFLFPHMDTMYKNSNESLVAYRQGVIAEAKANNVITNAANSSGDPLADEAGKAVVNLLTEGIKAKMGLVAPAATPPAATPPEVKK